jgi:hypothetical protein
MHMFDPADRACRICGEVTRLSFEHVPPKGTGNTGRVEMLGIEAWLAREDQGAEVRGTISQRGSGAYSLCRDCNSRAGELYVPEFKKLHGTGIQALSQFDLTALDARDDAGYVEMKWQGVRPGRLAKQIATMLLAISPGSFAQANAALTEYARDPSKVGLPPRYKLYLALYAGPNARYNGGSVAMKMNDGGDFDSIPVWELAYPPFAYVLTVDEEVPALETGNVTSFADAGIDETGELEMTLKVGFGHTIFPLDFRTKAKMEAHRGNGKEADQAA